MRIDISRSLEHGLLRGSTHGAQRHEKGLPVPVPAPPFFRHETQVGQDGIRTESKSMTVHVPVGTGIVQIHESRFRGRRHLTLQCVPHEDFRRIEDKIFQDPKYIPHQDRYAVLPAACADLGGLAADKAGPSGKSQFLPGELAAVHIQDIHVEEPSQTVSILQRRCDGLDLFHVTVQDIIFFISRLVSDDLREQYRNRGFVQGKLHPSYAFLESDPDQRRDFPGARDIHRKKEERFMISFQEFPLSQDAPVPCPEHILHFHRKFRRHGIIFFHSHPGSFPLRPAS